MKKLKFVCLSLVTLFLVVLGIVFGGIEVSAYTYNPNRSGDDFTPYVSQIVYCDLSLPNSIYEDGGWEVFVYIDDLDGLFQFRKDTDFSPVITDVIIDDRDWSPEGFWTLFGVDSMYWNPWKQYWQFEYPHGADWGAPESAKDFYDFDGKGIRLYFHQVWVDEFDSFEYANLVPIKDYEFDDGFLDEGSIYDFGRNFFNAYLLNYVIPYYLDEWGSGITIPEWDRTYVYFQPWNQLFTFEFRGSGLEYAVYCIEEYYNQGFDVGFDYGREDGLQDGYDYGYDYGYNYGYNEGYDVGYIEGVDLGYHDGYYEGYLDGLYISECGPIYEQGFKDGQESKLVENNQAFYAGIEKWLVPAIIAVIALGGFVTIAVNKRRGE